MKKTVFCSLIAAAMFFVGCGSSDSDPSNQNSQAGTGTQATHVGQSGVKDDVSNPNVVQIAVSSKDHSTLVAAVKAEWSRR